MSKTVACEIEGCEHNATSGMNGVRVCDRCRLDFVSVGLGAVRFGGRWHGVRGGVYTAEQRQSFPGIEEA